MLNVFLTVDTELWPAVQGWPRHPLPAGKTDFQSEYEACVLGRTSVGDYGLPYQLRLLNESGLKGVFLTEPMFSEVAGLALLRQTVDMVQRIGQEIGLHPHTEWLGEIQAKGLPASFGPAIHGYDSDGQKSIVRFSMARLVEAGARNVCSYRAGGYGANQATLDAVEDINIQFDTSYNRSYADSFPEWAHDDTFEIPRKIGAVWEVPVTNFNDYPGHVRHAQLCACSIRELEYLLFKAWRDKRQCFVIVWHSFELVRRTLRTDGKYDVEPNRIVIRRYEKLCRLLSRHRDKFRTMGFADAKNDLPFSTAEAPPLHSTLLNTGLRHIEQIASKWI